MKIVNWLIKKSYMLALRFGIVPISINNITDEVSYLREKNKLVLKVTGEWLIRPPLIIEHKIDSDWVSRFASSGQLRAINCTYCIQHRSTHDSLDCRDCPIYVMGTDCCDIDSDYIVANHAWEQHAQDSDRMLLIELGEQLSRVLKGRLS